jgi:hypothetical protein
MVKIILQKEWGNPLFRIDLTFIDQWFPAFIARDFLHYGEAQLGGTK